jgi:hypothetical protein
VSSATAVATDARLQGDATSVTLGSIVTELQVAGWRRQALMASDQTLRACQLSWPGSDFNAGLQMKATFEEELALHASLDNSVEYGLHLLQSGMQRSLMASANAGSFA